MIEGVAASLMSAGLQLVTEPSSGGSRLFAVPVEVQTTGVVSPLGLMLTPVTTPARLTAAASVCTSGTRRSPARMGSGSSCTGAAARLLAAHTTPWGTLLLSSQEPMITAVVSEPLLIAPPEQAPGNPALEVNNGGRAVAPPELMSYMAKKS